MEIFVSSINFVTQKQRRLSEIVPAMLDAGLRNIEISSIHPYEPGIQDKLMEWRSEARMLFHNYAPPSQEDLLLNLSSRNPENRKRSAEFIRDRILLCKKLGIDYYSFHAGFCVEYEFGRTDYTDIMPRKEGLDVFIEEVRDLADFAKSTGVHIGVENHVSKRNTQQLLFLDDIADFAYFFNQLDNNYLHLHLDLGHLNVSAVTRGFSKDDFIQKFSDKIFAIHAHDNDGSYDEHSPLSRDSWYLGALSDLERLKYIILETETTGNLEQITQMIDTVSSVI
ncbi:MAG: sugar phosphate isomerase/epimerase family protein [Candidatus Thorarchaeota archaeon]